MTTKNWQNSFIKPLGAIAILLLLLSVFPLGLLGICLYFNIDFSLVMSVIFTILAFFISISLFIFQKRASIYSVLALITGFFLLAGSVLSAYGTMYASILFFHAEGIINLVDSGLSDIGIGLGFITIAIAALKYILIPPKYSKYSVLGWLWLANGVWFLGIGIRAVIYGIHFWNINIGFYR